MGTTEYNEMEDEILHPDEGEGDPENDGKEEV